AGHRAGVGVRGGADVPQPHLRGRRAGGRAGRGRRGDRADHADRHGADHGAAAGGVRRGDADPGVGVDPRHHHPEPVGHPADAAGRGAARIRLRGRGVAAGVLGDLALLPRPRAVSGRWRVAAAAVTLGLSASLGMGGNGGVALAERPPAVDPGRKPAGDPAAPREPTERPANSHCSDILTGGEGPTIPDAQRALDLERAWQFSKGAGQRIAVIDTGVVRHPRLPGLEAGGDFVANSGDGTEDCDGHGTLVAGLIAASQVPGQGFAGVAPEAQIVTIRQTSKMYQKEGLSAQKNPEDLPDGYGNLYTMASAIVRAADMGVSVINISET